MTLEQELFAVDARERGIWRGLLDFGHGKPPVPRGAIGPRHDRARPAMAVVPSFAPMLVGRQHLRPWMGGVHGGSLAAVRVISGIGRHERDRPFAPGCERAALLPCNGILPDPPRASCPRLRHA